MTNKIDFTFGIITSPTSCGFLQKIVDSISDENIPNYEIIIIGGDSAHESENLTVVPFDDSTKPMWITKKKNIITDMARYENIVYLHDYIQLSSGWYRGFLQYGNNFQVCMTQIKNLSGGRYRDWTLWAEDAKFLNNIEFLIPYSMTHLSKLMYISGAYWVAKKSIMEIYRLDEELSWGGGEDVKWSKQIREKYQFSMNEHSSVELLKEKDPIFSISTQPTIDILNNITL